MSKKVAITFIFLFLNKNSMIWIFFPQMSLFLTILNKAVRIVKYDLRPLKKIRIVRKVAIPFFNS